MLDPRISIVIPAFNVAAYVRAALDSVLQQTVAPHEILVFDDGSTDETGAILAEYADQPRIRCFRQDNMRQGPTRNKGARLAEGDYLYFFDADDLLDVHFVERMQQLIVENDAPELIMFSGTGFTEHEELAPFVQDFRRNEQTEAVSGVEAVPLLDADGWVYSAPWLYLTKASFWREHGFSFPSTFNEDEDVIVPLIAEAQTVLIKDEILIRQRIRRESTTTEARNRDHLLALESNLCHAIRDISRVPSSAKEARKLLRNRCRIVAKQYLGLTRELDEPVRKRLIVRAAIKTGKLKLLKKTLSERER